MRSEGNNDLDDINRPPPVPCPPNHVGGPYPARECDDALGLMLDQHILVAHWPRRPAVLRPVCWNRYDIERKSFAPLVGHPIGPVSRPVNNLAWAPPHADKFGHYVVKHRLIIEVAATADQPCFVVHDCDVCCHGVTDVGPSCLKT